MENYGIWTPWIRAMSAPGSQLAFEMTKATVIGIQMQFLSILAAGSSLSVGDASAASKVQ